MVLLSLGLSVFLNILPAANPQQELYNVTVQDESHCRQLVVTTDFEVMDATRRMLVVFDAAGNPQIVTPTRTYTMNEQEDEVEAAALNCAPLPKK